MIDLANDSEYGYKLQYLLKILNMQKIALKIQVGTVNINKSASRGPDILFFFGIKKSGFGIQGIIYSIKSMSQLKVLLLINKNSHSMGVFV